jgi:BCD family chlorophyll transporter-like MFS transporter
MWKQEARDRVRGNAPRGPEPSFAQAWAKLTARPGLVRLLAIIAFGTAGFGMADVLIEPFGGQVLQMSVAETTRLTVYLALGTLVGFTMASRWIGRGRARPIDVAIYGALIGAPAFGLIILSAHLLSVPVLIVAILAAGFGAGLFGHGTLTTTMRCAPRDHIGLSLGAWGAVQTTSAGVSIVVGGFLRDRLQSGGAGVHSGGAYMSKSFWPMKLVSTPATKRSAISGGMLMSSMFGLATIYHR